MRELTERFRESYRVYLCRLIEQMLDVEQYFPESKRAGLRREIGDGPEAADELLDLFGTYALGWWPDLYPVHTTELYQRAIFGTLIMGLALDVALNEGEKGFVRMGYSPAEARELVDLCANASLYVEDYG